MTKEEKAVVRAAMRWWFKVGKNVDANNYINQYTYLGKLRKACARHAASAKRKGKRHA